MKDAPLDFDGFILPDGERVRFDDLGAMERSLRRHFGGDLRGILRGLRSLSLQLAIEGRTGPRQDGGLN